MNEYVAEFDEDIGGNDVIEEVDEKFEEKRGMLIRHFKKAYDSGLVSWPRCFDNEKKSIYNLAKSRMI